jgi:hypothetical protein
MMHDLYSAWRFGEGDIHGHCIGSDWVRNEIKMKNHPSCLFCPNSVSKKKYFAIVLYSSAIFKVRYRISL